MWRHMREPTCRALGISDSSRSWDKMYGILLVQPESDGYSHCLEFVNQVVVDAGKYLGIFIGPKCGPPQWSKALRKFHERILQIHTLRLPTPLVISQFNRKAVPVLGYIAQFVPPPKDITRIGLNAVIKCLRMAGNSLSFNTAFNLGELGGPCFTNLTLHLNACLLRAANKTFIGHAEQHNALVSLALDSFSFSSFNSLNVEVGIPLGWDSPAFCSNLHTSRNLVGGALPPLPRSSRGEDQIGGSLQARYYSRLHELQPNPTASWVLLLNARAEKINAYHGNETQFSLSPDGYLELTRILKLCGEGTRNMAIKTLVNSWATSSRMGEKDKLDCLFCGHHKGDRLHHYLKCDPLWTLIVSCAGLGTEYLGASALVRGGYISPSVVGCNLIACAFLVYHAIKLQHTEVAMDAIACGDFTVVTQLVLELAAFHLNAISFIKPFVSASSIRHSVVRTSLALRRPTNQ